MTNTGIFQKKIKIGKYETKNNVFMAPLAGYTDVAFRNMVRRLGAGLTVTEMVSCKGLVYGNEKTEELLIVGNEESPSVAQIFGREPEIMQRAVQLPVLSKFDIIDVNMGCPVPKLVKNGEGSALLKEPHLAEAIVKSLVKTGKTITVKMRIGIKDSDYVTQEFARRMEGAGAAMITIHGRVREAYYAGEPNYAEIAKAVSAVSVPVIANGGIFSLQEGERMMQETGAAGIMLARGAMFEPRLFCDFQGQERPPFAPIIIRQLEELESTPDPRFAAINFRKQFVAYLHGVRGGKRVKDAVFAAEDLQTLKTLAGQVNWN